MTLRRKRKKQNGNSPSQIHNLIKKDGRRSWIGSSPRPRNSLVVRLYPRWKATMVRKFACIVGRWFAIIINFIVFRSRRCWCRRQTRGWPWPLLWRAFVRRIFSAYGRGPWGASPWASCRWGRWTRRPGRTRGRSCRWCRRASLGQREIERVSLVMGYGSFFIFLFLCDWNDSLGNYVCKQKLYLS